MSSPPPLPTLPPSIEGDVCWPNTSILNIFSKMLVYDGELLVNDDEMSVSYTYFIIIKELFTSISLK